MTKFFLISLLLTWFSFTHDIAQQQQLNWVNAHALPIDSNGKYLAYLTGQLKGNTICGLAEASHGTHEFSAEKNRIINYLITYADYKSIGFEFGYSAMERINNYLLTGHGDLKKFMAQLRLYNTKEIFDLFQSIKAYNDGKPIKNKVTLFGFDTDYIKADMDSSAIYCINYLAKNAQLYTNGQTAVPVLKKIATPNFSNLYELEDGDMAIISRLNDEIKIKDNSAVKGSGLFKKHLSLLYQGTLVSNPLARDKFMAENIASVQQENKAKTIIWGHNVHLAKDTTMAQCKGMVTT